MYDGVKTVLKFYTIKFVRLSNDISPAEFVKIL
jgi:hypothetical protein